MIDQSSEELELYISRDLQPSLRGYDLAHTDSKLSMIWRLCSVNIAARQYYDHFSLESVGTILPGNIVRRRVRQDIVSFKESAGFSRRHFRDFHPDIIVPPPMILSLGGIFPPSPVIRYQTDL